MVTVLLGLHLQSCFLATQVPPTLQRSKDGLALPLSLLPAEPQFLP